MSFETHTGTFSFLLLLNKWDPQVALFPDSAEGQSLESLDPCLETPPDGFCHFLPQKMCIMYIHRISWIFRDDMLCQNQSNITWNRLPMIIRLISRLKVRGTVMIFQLSKLFPNRGFNRFNCKCSSVFLEMSPCYPRQRRLEMFNSSNCGSQFTSTIYGF